MSREKLDAKQFARQHWPEALLAAVTISGAATWLLIRYYKQKNLSKSTRFELDVLEAEAVVGVIDPVVLLETGADFVRQTPGSPIVAAEMVDAIPSEPGREAMIVLSQLPDFAPRNVGTHRKRK